MQLTKTIALGATALAILGSPMPAAAMKIKWLTCQLYDSTRNQVIHLHGAYAMGGTVDVDAQYDAFLKAAKNQGQIDENSKTEGACTLSDSQDEAEGGVTGFVNHFKAQGARENTVGFAPS